MGTYFDAIKKIPHNIILAFENEAIPLLSYWVTFFFILELRFFIESYSTTANYFNETRLYFLFDMIHYNLSFITLALFFIILFHYATKLSITATARVVLPSFMLLLLAPLIDLLVTKGKGIDIYYMGPWADINIVLTYLTYFNLGGFEGASLGIKYEAFIALLCCFTYFRLKHCNFWRSLFFTWACYTCIFIWASSPYFIKWFLETTKLDLDFASHCDSILMTKFYLIILVFLSPAVFYLADKKMFLTLLKNILLQPWIYYEFMLIFGITLAFTKANTTLTTQLLIQPNILINTIFCMISILFSGISSGSMHLSAQEKMLIHYKTLGYITLAIAFFYAAMSGIKVFLIILIMNAINYIHTQPPIALKRFLYFSKFVIAFNSLAAILLGYLIVFDNVYLFPQELFWIILIGYTVLAYFIDLENYDDHHKNFSYRLTISQKKILSGLACFLIYLSYFFLFQNNGLIFILLIIGGLQFCFIVRKNFKRWPIVLLNYGSILFFIIGLLAKKICLR